jgi:hypothetical protein
LRKATDEHGFGKVEESDASEMRPYLWESVAEMSKADVLLQIRRELLRTQALVKALEAIIVEKLPVEERAAWYDRLTVLRKHYHQKALSAAEDASPSLGAWLDDRPLDEV